MKKQILLGLVVFSVALIASPANSKGKGPPATKPSPPPLPDGVEPPLSPEERITTATWEEIRQVPATVEVTGMKPVPLEREDGKNGWKQVPEQFTKTRTLIFKPADPQVGVADYKVTKGGYLVLACNFVNQGNNGGHWKETRWLPDDFYAHGWRDAQNSGGRLIKAGGRQQLIFVKKVEAGESGKLRCNKYDPPFFIQCSNEPVP